MRLPKHIVYSGNGFYKDLNTGKFYHDSFIEDVVKKYRKDERNRYEAEEERMKEYNRAIYNTTYIEKRMFMQNIQAARGWGVGIFETMG